ncbi:MAG: helix-turn-helix transcriptional regulator [Bryobacteraceae bacterium]
MRSFLGRFVTDPESLAAPWTLESMAAECGLKATQFVRHVNELTNLAPMHYVNYYRLEHALRLLKSKTSMSITEIAFECGFSSSQYFATLFRQRFGMAPKEFRNCATGQF